MIDRASIRHRGLSELVRRGRSKLIAKALEQRVRNRLAVLDVITTVAELPPSYRAHSLRGTRRETWSIWVSGSWRMTFRFSKEKVYDLDLEQYH